MKYISIGVLLILINTLYWGFSEQYINEGAFIDGIVKGFVLSCCCAVWGFMLGRIFK